MIEITENAAKQITKMLEKRAMTGGGLRIGLRAGGCSGYEYTFAWETEPRPDDHVFVGPGDARVFVDPRSFRLLDGVVVDYDANPVGRGFMFQNPNAKSTCGCGTSFSV
ncbi:MAG TPA: iron-sulfur cluster assembly accessory protein [Vicinamibacterales bacterium]|nr:iron-sulfur cluster assembly accessory protein [Vicinamibacterales bacterium]